jgi:SNF2 family DNA or RNA helicase
VFDNNNNSTISNNNTFKIELNDDEDIIIERHTEKKTKKGKKEKERSTLSRSDDASENSGSWIEIDDDAVEDDEFQLEGEEAKERKSERKRELPPRNKQSALFFPSASSSKGKKDDRSKVKKVKGPRDPEFKHSTKTEAIFKELKRVLKDFPKDKCLIFSYFTSFLDIIQSKVKNELSHINFERFDGMMSKSQKSHALSSFEKYKDIRLLLVSTKAGGVGLNLTAANHVFMLDPWWNPAEEKQAFQRVYRMGQTKTVYIYKFIVSDSVETRIQEKQQAKQALSDNSLASSESPFFKFGNKGLTVADLRHFFSKTKK